MFKIVITRTETSDEYFRSLRKYLLQKEYNTDFGDIAPAILSNAFKVNIVVWNEVSPTCVYNTQAFSLHDTNITIAMHCRSDHYNVNGLVYASVPGPFSVESMIKNTLHHRKQDHDDANTNTQVATSAIPSTTAATLCDTLAVSSVAMASSFSSAVGVIYSSTELKYLRSEHYGVSRST